MRSSGARGVCLTASILLALPAPLSAAERKSPDGPQNAYGCNRTGMGVGMLLGAVAGAALASQVEDNKKRAVLMGAVLGAVLGGAVGHELDRRKCELKKIAAQNRLALEVQTITTTTPAPPGNRAAGPTKVEIGLLVAVQESPEQFASGSDALSPDAQRYFGEIADTYVHGKQAATLPTDASDEQRSAIEALKGKIILLVGHTDDVGSTEANAGLSEARARAVAKLLAERGMPMEDIYYQGAGETLPVADNATEAGRKRNRRVEFIDVPDLQSLSLYLASRAGKVEHFRAAAEPVVIVAEALPTVDPPPPARKKGQVPRAQASSIPRASILVGQASAPALPSTAKPLAAKAAARPAAPKVVAPKVVAATTFDFGGIPAVDVRSPAIGREVKPRKVALARRAVAAEVATPGLPACAADRPRVAYAVKSLKSGAELPFGTADYMPGLYGTSWMALVNGHLVGLTRVTVLKDGGRPAAKPELMLFKDYARSPDPTRAPDVRTKPDVNVYRGERGLLYRVFAHGSANLSCVDMLLPAGGGFAAPGSRLFYDQAGDSYVADFAPAIHR